MQDRRPQLASSNRPQSTAPEVELLFACLRWPQTALDRETIRTLVTPDLDVKQFVFLAHHHRVVPLVATNLSASFPGTPRQPIGAALQDLRALAEFNTLEALRSLRELRRVVTALESAGIAARVIKGLPLAQSVFGNLALRSPGDIDLLIMQDRIKEADHVLRSLGYDPILPVERFSPRQFDFYSAHWKDMAYENHGNGFNLDLHWRCFRNAAMPGLELCSAGPATVSFGSFRVQTLPRDEGLLYLCVHGTLDGWIYLKALADVAVELRSKSSEELDRLADLAVKYGVLPELTATLVLLRRYLGLRVWSSRLLPEQHPTVAHILRYVAQTLEKRGFSAGREEIPIATTLAFEFGLRRAFRYRWEILMRIVFRARMFQAIRLPDFLFPIYPLLSPFEWLIHRFRRNRVKGSAEAKGLI